MSFTLSFLKQDATTAIVNSLLTEPSSWTWLDDGRSILVHRTAKIQLWVGTRTPYLYKPERVKFDFWDGRRLRKAYHHWMEKVGRGQILATEKAALSIVVEKLHVLDAR